MKSKLTLLVASLLFIIAPIFVQNASAQLEFPEDKVSWNFSIEQHGDEATLVGKITMLEHWHIYAVHLPDGVFTLPTELVLDPSSAYRKNGKVTEPKPHFEHDEMADEDLYYHSNTIFLKQKIKITSTKDFKLTGKFGFQTCDSTHCLPPFETGFSVNVKGVNPEAKPAPIDELNVPIESSAVTPQVEISVPSSEVETNKETSSSKDLEEDTPVNNDTDNMSVWAIFALSFASGLAALLTPCVFPMIPMTVSFFTKQVKQELKGFRTQ